MHGGVKANVLLRGANLRDAQLAGMDLHGYDFDGADLTDANLGHANLDNVKNLTAEQVSQACGNGSVTLDSKRIELKRCENVPREWTATIPLGACKDPPNGDRSSASNQARCQNIKQPYALFNGSLSWDIQQSDRIARCNCELDSTIVALLPRN